MPLAEHRRHHAWPIGLLLITLLLIAGCVNVEVESEFHDDGSASHMLEFAVPRNIVDQVSGQLGDEFDPASIFEVVEQQAAERGLETERIETSDELGIRITASDVQDNSDLGATLMSMLPTQVEAPTDAFEGSYVVEDGEYRLDLTVDGSQLVNQLTPTGELGELPIPNPSTLVDITYTATMPGRIDEDRTNGQVVSDNQVRWTIGVDEEVTMSAVATDEEGDTPWLLYGIVGVIVIVLLVGIAILLFVLTRRGGAMQAKPSTSSEPTEPPDQS